MDEAIRKAQYGLLFDIRRSRRYHLARIVFFRRFHRIRLLTIAIGASSTFVVVVQENSDLTFWFSLFTALIGILEGIIQFETRMNQHQELSRRYATLEAAIVRLGERIKSAELDEFQGAYLEIEIDEPPPNQTLSELCHNQEVLARHSENAWRDHLIEIPWWRRALASFSGLYPYFDWSVQQLIDRQKSLKEPAT